MPSDPRFDPRIVHLWAENMEWTLCGFSRVKLAEEGALESQSPGTTVYRCLHCLHMALKHSYSPDA